MLTPLLFTPRLLRDGGDAEDVSGRIRNPIFNLRWRIGKIKTPLQVIPIECSAEPDEDQPGDDHPDGAQFQRSDTLLQEDEAQQGPQDHGELP